LAQFSCLQKKMTSSTELWIEAQYALGRLEHKLGEQLDWRGRREFILNYLKEHELEQKKE
jgi:hypothetical protein